MRNEFSMIRTTNKTFTARKKQKQRFRTIPRERQRIQQCKRAAKAGIVVFEEKYSPASPSPALFLERTVFIYPYGALKALQYVGI